jgi:hypothetical protein
MIRGLAREIAGNWGVRWDAGCQMLHGTALELGRAVKEVCED